MKTNLNVIRVLSRKPRNDYIGTVKKNRLVDLGERHAMNVNVGITLTEQQIKQIEEQTKLAVDEAILNGNLDSCIKEVVKGQIKSIVNEVMQEKNYKRKVTDRVVDVLMKAKVVEELYV